MFKYCFRTYVVLFLVPALYLITAQLSKIFESLSFLNFTAPEQYKILLTIMYVFSFILSVLIIFNSGCDYREFHIFRNFKNVTYSKFWSYILAVPVVLNFHIEGFSFTTFMLFVEPIAIYMYIHQHNRFVLSHNLVHVEEQP